MISKLIVNGNERVVDHTLELVLRILSLGGGNVKRDFCCLLANIGLVQNLTMKLLSLSQLPLEEEEEDSDSGWDEEEEEEEVFYCLIVTLT